MPDTKRQKCVCRDCLVETIEGMCQRCRTHRCSARSDKDCACPSAYALSARKKDEKDVDERQPVEHN